MRLFLALIAIACLVATIPAASASPPPKPCTMVFPDSVFCLLGVDDPTDPLDACLRAGDCTIPDPLGRCPPDSWCPPEES